MGKKELVGTASGLSDEEKDSLLKLARATLEKKLLGKGMPGEGGEESSILKEIRGAFVSLHKKGMLRGCIGCIEGRKPLVATIEEMVNCAAFRDPRFPPVGPDELKDLDIEISVLTPLQQISNTGEITVGVHGLLVERGNCCGLLLPQVATEWGWDRIKFLEETCRKAGLPPGAWKEKGTKVYIFSADVFGEGRT